MRTAACLARRLGSELGPLPERPIGLAGVSLNGPRLPTLFRGSLLPFRPKSCQCACPISGKHRIGGRTLAVGYKDYIR